MQGAMGNAKIVKSADRTLLVFELFAIWRRAATASEIEAALDMPQSSTSVLLRSLTELGYLEYNPAGRTYRPTLRIAMLSDWMRSTVLESLHAERVDELRDRTGETVLVGRRQGSYIHYVQISRSGQELQFFVHEGTRRPLCLSASGRALLSTLPDDTVLRIARENNETAMVRSDIVDPQRLLQVMQQIRETGLSETSSLLGEERDIHAISTLMPGKTKDEPFSLGIAGPKERVLRQRNSLIAALREWMGRYCE